MAARSGDLRVVWPTSSRAIVKAEGLVLREWDERDAAVMVDLFDTDEMDRRTPLESPFDLAAADRYVRHARRCRTEVGSIQLAITEDGSVPLGEVLAFPGGRDGVAELAYAVGHAHQGRGLASRAVRALLPHIAAAGYASAILLIADDNTPSQRVAGAAGFVRTAVPYVERRRKGNVLRLATWERDLQLVACNRG
jgi:RimJ/RimL family protein N-acetyltransferase